jgi:5-methylthioadenosine/S-adenosylhomocysteine deaminase
LGDGICDVIGFRERGVAVGLGTDAGVRTSAIAEMRAAALLQKLARLDGAALPAHDAFLLATSEGAGALGVTAGTLAAGVPADYVVLDATQFDPWSPDCNALVYRAEDAWIQAVFVGGQRVYVGEPSAQARRAREETAKVAQRLL